MADVIKTIQSAQEIVFQNGVEALRVTFTDQSVVIWAVEDEGHANEIKAMIGEKIAITDDEEFPEYWVSTSVH